MTKLKNTILINCYFFAIDARIQKITKYLNEEMTEKKVYYKPIIRILSRQRYKNLKTFLSW